MPKISLTNTQPYNNSPQENLQKLTQDTQEIKQFLQSVNPFQFNLKDSLENISEKLDSVIDLLTQQNKIFSLKQKNQQEDKTTLGETIQEKVRPQTTNVSEQIKNKRNELNFRNKLISFLSTINSQLLNIPKLIVSPIVSLFKPYVGLFTKLFGFLNKFIFNAPWFKWILKSGQVLFKWLYQYLILSIFRFLLSPLKFLWGGLKFLGGGLLKLLTPVLGILFKPLLWLLKPLFKPLLVIGKFLWTPIKWLGGLLLKPLKQLSSQFQKPFQGLFSKLGKKTLQKSVQEKQVGKETITQQKGGQLQSISQFINSLGTPQQILGQVTLILIQVQLRILRPIIEKFIDVQGNVFIKQIQGIVEVLKDVGVTVRQSIGQFVDIIRVVQELQKQGDSVQKNFKLISSGIVQIGFAFVEFSQQLIGVNIQQLTNVITTFTGRLVGQKPSTIVDFINLFINNFVNRLISIQKETNVKDISKLDNISRVTILFVSTLNQFSNILVKYQFINTLNNILNIFNPLEWFRNKSKENPVVTLINNYLNNFLVPIFNITQTLPNINTQKIENLSKLSEIGLKQLLVFNSVFGKYNFSSTINSIISWLLPVKDKHQGFIDLVKSYFNDFLIPYINTSKKLQSIDDKTLLQVDRILKVSEPALSSLKNFKEITSKVNFSDLISELLNKVLTFVFKKDESERFREKFNSYVDFLNIFIESIRNLKVTQVDDIKIQQFNKISQIVESVYNNIEKFGEITNKIKSLQINWSNIPQVVKTHLSIIGTTLNSLVSDDGLHIVLKKYLELRRRISDFITNEKINMSPDSFINLLFSGIRGFSTGGFTGKGQINEVQGIVHKNEYVIPSFLIDKYQDVISQIERDRVQFLQKSKSTQTQVSKGVKNIQSTVNQIQNMGYRPLQVGGTQQTSLVLKNVQSNETNLQSIGRIFKNIFGVILPEISKTVNNQSFDIKPEKLSFFDKIILLTIKLQQLQKTSKDLSNISEITKNIVKYGKSVNQYVKTLSKTIEGVPETFKENIRLTGTDLMKQTKQQKIGTGTDIIQQLKSDLSGSIGTLYDTNIGMTSTSGDFISYLTKIIPTLQFESLQQKQGLSKLHPLFLEKLKVFMNVLFNEQKKQLKGQIPIIQINSSYRSIEEQIALYKKNPKTQQQPGNSPHQYGFQLDYSVIDPKTKKVITGQQQIKQQSLKQQSVQGLIHGLQLKNFESEPWHVQMPNWEQYVPDQVWQYVDELLRKYKLPPRTVGKKVSPTKSKGFSIGGFTGIGDIEEVQGIVHKNEYVIPSFLIEKYKDVILQIEQDRLNYLNKMSTSLKQFAEGGQTSSVFTLSKQNNKLDVTTITVNFTNELKLEGVKIKDIGTQIVMLQLSYIDKYGREDKELQEQFGKVTKSIVGTIIEQYSKDSFLKSLNDTLVLIFEKIPLLNSKDIQNVLKQSLQELLRKILESVNTYLANLVGDIKVENLETNMKKQFEEKNRGIKYVTLNEVLINIITSVIEYTKNVLSNSFGFVNSWFVKIFYQLDVQQKLIEMLISHLSDQELYSTVFKQVFNNIIPTLLTTLMNTQFIITDKMSYKEIVEKNSSFEKSLNSLLTSMVMLFNFVFENISTSLSGSISMIKDLLWGQINGIVRLYLSSIIVTELITSLSSFLPKLLNDIILSNLYDKITKYLSSYIDTTWSLTMDKLLKKFETEEDLTKLNLKIKEYPVQETLQDVFKNFTDSVNRFVQQIMSVTFEIFTDVFNRISSLINNPTTSKILKFVSFGILAYLVFELGKSLINPKFWQKIGKSISNLVNNLADLISESISQTDISKFISTQSLSNIVGNVVNFILNVFSEVTDLLFTDKMIKMQVSLLESNNIVLNIVGTILPILSLVVMGLMSYMIYNTANEIVNIFKILFTPENISRQQSQMSSSDLLKIVESVVSGVLSIFTSVISGQFNLITSNLGSDLSSAASQALGPVGIILDFGMSFLLKGMQLVLMVQMSVILGHVIDLISKITPSIIRIFEILFSTDNLNKLQLSLLFDNVEKYQDLTINIVNKIIDLMVNLSIKIIDFVVDNNKSGNLLTNIMNINLNIFNLVTNMIMKLFILPKMLNILTQVIKLFENIVPSIIYVFKVLFDKDNLQQMINSILSDNIDKYWSLQVNTISTIIDFMVESTLLVIQYVIQKRTTTGGVGFLGLLFGFINGIIDTIFNQIFNTKFVQILDNTIKLLQNVGETLPTLFETLFSKENLDTLVDYLLTSAHDKYFDLQSKIILSTIDFMSNVSLMQINYAINFKVGQSQSFGGFLFGWLFRIINNIIDTVFSTIFKTKIASIVSSTTDLVIQVSNSLQTIFKVLFSVDNINKLMTYFTSNGIEKYQDLTTNIITNIINFMLDVSLQTIKYALEFKPNSSILVNLLSFLTGGLSSIIDSIIKSILQSKIIVLLNETIKLLQGVTESIKQIFGSLFSKENLQKLMEYLTSEQGFEKYQGITSSIISSMINLVIQVTLKVLEYVLNYKDTIFMGIPLVDIGRKIFELKLKNKILTLVDIVSNLFSDIVTPLKTLFNTLFSESNLSKLIDNYLITEKGQEKYQEIIQNVIKSITDLMVQITLKVLEYATKYKDESNVKVIYILFTPVFKITKSNFEKELRNRILTIISTVQNSFTNISRSIETLFEMLFSKSNLSKLIDNYLITEKGQEKYQEIVQSVIKSITDLMVRVTLKVLEYSINYSLSQRNNVQLVRKIDNEGREVIETISDKFYEEIFGKNINLIELISIMFKNISTSISILFDTLFSEDNINKLVNYLVTQGQDKYFDIVSNVVSSMVELIIRMTLEILKYSLSYKPTWITSLTKEISFNTILSKNLKLIDIITDMFINISGSIQTLFDTLFSKDNINKLIDYLVTQGQDKYFDLQSNVILSITDMFIKIVFEVVKYTMTMSLKQNMFGKGLDKNQFVDKMKVLVDTVITLMLNITSSIKTIFDTMFSQENINNLVRWMITEDVKTYQTFMLNTIGKFLDMYIQIATLSVTETLKRTLSTSTRINRIYTPFVNEMTKIMRAIQNNISQVSSQVVKLINVFFSESNLMKLLNEEGLLKEILIEIIKNIVHTILSPLYSILGEQQYKQLTKRQIKYVTTYRQFLWFRIPIVRVVETASLQEQLQNKIDEVMKVVVSNIIKQLDSLKQYVEKTDLSITLINSFIQSLNVITEKLEEQLLQNIDFDTIWYEFDFQNKQIQFKIQNVNELKTKFEETKLELMNEQNNILTNIHKELIEIKEIIKEIRDNDIVKKQNTNSEYVFPYLEKLSIGS